MKLSVAYMERSLTIPFTLYMNIGQDGLANLKRMGFITTNPIISHFNYHTASFGKSYFDSHINRENGGGGLYIIALPVENDNFEMFGKCVVFAFGKYLR